LGRDHLGKLQVAPHLPAGTFQPRPCRTHRRSGDRLNCADWHRRRTPRPAPRRRHFALSPRERAALYLYPAEIRGREFLKLWTLKEAIAEPSGEGVAVASPGLYERFRVDIEILHEARGAVFMVGHYAGTSNRDEDFRVRVVHKSTLVNGKIVAFEQFADSAPMKRARGTD
jgi:ketosteroid isomerase-like protein